MKILEKIWRKWFIVSCPICKSPINMHKDCKIEVNVESKGKIEIENFWVVDKCSNPLCKWSSLK